MTIAGCKGVLDFKIFALLLPIFGPPCLQLSKNMLIQITSTREQINYKYN